MKNLTRIAVLLGASMTVAGCGQRQSEPASTTPSPTSAQDSTADSGRPMEADDPQAGTNTSRPDAPKDIKPEPGTPAVP